MADDKELDPRKSVCEDVLPKEKSEKENKRKRKSEVELPALPAKKPSNQPGTSTAVSATVTSQEALNISNFQPASPLMTA